MFRVLAIAVCTIVIILVNAIITIFPWRFLQGLFIGCSFDEQV